jgi:hypothetical protein
MTQGADRLDRSMVLGLVTLAVLVVANVAPAKAAAAE